MGLLPVFTICCPCLFAWSPLPFYDYFMSTIVCLFHPIDYYIRIIIYIRLPLLLISYKMVNFRAPLIYPHIPLILMLLPFFLIASDFLISSFNNTFHVDNVNIKSSLMKIGYIILDSFISKNSKKLVFQKFSFLLL